MNFIDTTGGPDNFLRGISVPEMATTIGISPQAVHTSINNMNIEGIIKSGKRYFSPEAARIFFSHRGYEYPKEIISFWIIKGGVGKTSLLYAFAKRARQFGFRVLCIDIDQQSNLTKVFGLEESARRSPILYDYLKSTSTSSVIDFSSLIMRTSDGVDLIPSNMTNSLLDRELNNLSEPLDKIFKKKLLPLKEQYDYILIDYPPTINKVTASFVLSSDRVILPITPGMFSADGLNITFKEIKTLFYSYEIKEPILSILWNRFDIRRKLSSESYVDLEGSEKYKSYILSTVFRESASLDSAISSRTDIFCKNGSVKEDTDSFLKEISGLDRIGKRIRQ